MLKYEIIDIAENTLMNLAQFSSTKRKNRKLIRTNFTIEIYLF